MPGRGAAPVGVFDSGAGGLSVVAAIRAALPALPIRYFADTAYAPYGERSEEEILERTRYACGRLLQEGACALVIACNTATANAIDTIRSEVGVPVIGVEPGLKPGAATTKSGVVGVLATQATLASERYRTLARKVQADAPGVRFLEHAARGWVELVEAGEIDSPRASQSVRTAIEPLLAQGADTLVLGCTHYPFLRGAIERAARGASVIETGPAVARELQRRLPEQDLASSAGRGPLRFESSGDPAQFEALAHRLLAR